MTSVDAKEWVAPGPILGGLLLAHFWWGSAFLSTCHSQMAGLLAGFGLAGAEPEESRHDPTRWVPGLSMLELGSLTS